MDQKRIYIHCSASINNWREKIFKRYKAKEYKWWKHLFQPVTFFGLYRPYDFLVFLLHRGFKTVHWQGSDILQAGWHYWWLQKIKAKHICENEVEQGVLRLMLQQEIEVRPTFLSNPHEFKISFRPQKNPEVYIHINRNAEKESGLDVVQRCARFVPEVIYHVYGKYGPRKPERNIKFHGYVSEEEFNRQIRGYSAGLRLHVFDGMSEIISKSILLGQYPISYIRYPYIDTYKNEEELIKLLKNLKNKKKPNYKARDYYMKEFTKKYG